MLRATLEQAVPNVKHSVRNDRLRSKHRQAAGMVRVYGVAGAGRGGMIAGV